MSIRTNYSGDAQGTIDRPLPRVNPRNNSSGDELEESILPAAELEGPSAGQSTVTKEQSPGEQIDVEIAKNAGLPGIQSLINDRDELRRQHMVCNEKIERYRREGENLRSQYKLAANEQSGAQAEHEAAKSRGDKAAMDRALVKTSTASKKVEALKVELQKHNDDSIKDELYEKIERFNVAYCAFDEKRKRYQWLISMLNPGVSCDLTQFTREYEQNKRFMENW
jgi:chromosome segregation ATPase